MYRGKHEMPRKGLAKYKKSHIMLVSLLLVMTIGVGATVAFLMDSTDALVNIFKPSHVSCVVDETFDGNTKSKVSIKNTSNIPAYIRAEVIVTWQKVENEKVYIYKETPVLDEDYTIMFPENSKWVLGSDGYYYWPDPVNPATESDLGLTGTLIQTCTLKDGATPPDGYYLCVEIIAEAIQAEGMGATSAQDAFAEAAGGGA